MRLFPVTARQRLLVAATAIALGVGATTPLGSTHAWADIKHLRHEQSQAQHSVKSAQADLDESSQQSRRAFEALTRSRSDLRAARHDLQVARAHVQDARHQLNKTRRQLDRAKERLARAEANLAREQQAVSDQRDQLVQTVTGFYEGGDPQLLGVMSMLGSTTTSELTDKQNNNSFVLDSQDQILDSLKASEVLLTVQTDEREKARDQVARKKEQARANLEVKRDYRAQAVDAKQRVAKNVRLKKHAVKLARKARAHDRAILARSKAHQARVHRMLMAEIAREQRRGGGYHGDTGGLLMRPVNGPITSPYGWRIHPIYGYWGLHDGDDFGAPCGAPSVRRRQRHGDVAVLLVGLGQPPLPQPRADQRPERHGHLQPPVGVPQPRRPARLPRPGGRAGRHDRMVDRLPHPLHGDGQRQAGEPDAVVRLIQPIQQTSTPAQHNPVDAPWENGGMAREQGRKLIASNRKARHDYHVEDTWEAGLVLMGTEVKSLRQGRATLVDGFAEVDDHEVWLHGVHIPEYTQGTWTNHSARRRRKLLLNRTEIDKIERKITDKGYTLVPLALYFKDGRAKVEIALARGKKTYDKRHALAERQANREQEQAVGRRLKGHTD